MRRSFARQDAGPQAAMTPAMRRMVQARSRLILSNSFWGTLAMSLELVEAPGIGTMATDATCILFDPDFVMTLTEPEVLGVLMHEVAHCADRHPARRGQRDHVVWNIACDFRVNFDVKECGYVLPWAGATLAQLLAGNPPKGQHRHLFDPQFADMGAEEIYRIVTDAMAKKQRQQLQPGQQPGQNGAAPGQGAPQSAPNQPGGAGVAAGQPNAPAGTQGPANGNSPGAGIPEDWGDPGGCGGVLDAAPSHDPVGNAEVARRWETAVRQAVAVLQRQVGAGNLPGYAQRQIDELDTPRIDWRRELRRFADGQTKRDYSWRRPNRRHLWRGLILPGLVTDRANHIVVVQDTSGSVYAGEPQKAFASEVQAMLDEAVCDTLTVAYADTEVKGEPETYTPGDLIKMDVEGGGGTAFREPLAWVMETFPDVTAIVYLTDAETSDWGDDPGVPVLWAVCGEEKRARQYANRAPFGQALFIGD